MAPASVAPHRAELERATAAAQCLAPLRVGTCARCAHKGHYPEPETSDSAHRGGGGPPPGVTRGRSTNVGRGPPPPLPRTYGPGHAPPPPHTGWETRGRGGRGCSLEQRPVALAGRRMMLRDTAGPTIGSSCPRTLGHRGGDCCRCPGGRNDGTDSTGHP